MKNLFPYCQPEFIKGEYRRQLILRELLGYKADIICLQEMDTKLFYNYYLRQLHRKGFDGVLKQKQEKVQEGVGTFFRTDKYRLQSQHDISLSTSLFDDPLYSDLAAAVNAKPKLKEILAERTNPLQVRENICERFGVYVDSENFLELHR